MSAMFYMLMPLPRIPKSLMFKGANATKFVGCYEDFYLDY